MFDDLKMKPTERGASKGKRNKARVCDRCGRTYTEAPALSRVVAEWELCPECGMFEAIEAFNSNYLKHLSSSKEE